MKVNLNIKIRLTLWYLFILAVILAFFSTVTYFLLSESLYDIARSPSRLCIVRPEYVFSEGLPSDLSEQPIPLVSYTISEEWLERLQSGANSTLSIHAPRGQMVIDQKSFITSDMSGEQQVQIFFRPKLDNPGSSELFAIVQPVSEVSDTLAAFRRVLAYVIPITSVLAALLGFFLIWRMLKPVHAITMTAREIGEKGLSRRIEVSNKNDELGKLAATLNWVFDRLQNALSRERQFTADVSHELRTPLSIIRGEASLALTKERSSDAYRKSLGVIAAEIGHMSSTVNRLLALTRTDSGTETLNLSRIDLADFLTDLALDVEALCEEKSITFRLNIQDRLTVEGDKVKLRELFLNLLDNAVRYTGSKGNVTVSLNKKGGEACVAVSDTGAGIPQEHLPHIFERFYRVDKTDSFGPSGSGLGLAISRSIVELHHGTIEAESEIGIGSTFSVLIPLVNIG